MRRNLIDGQWLTDTELTALFMRELEFESHRMVPNDPREIVQERRGKVPNESDFCAICGALCWGPLCDDCQKKPVREVVERVAAVSLTRMTDDELAGHIGSLQRAGAGREYELAKAEARRRIQLAEREERERKRRAL